MGFFRKMGRTRAFAIVFALLTSDASAMAEATVQFPVSVPMECVELAQREGVPTVINNKYEAVKAKLKLARLSGRDPMVHQCREAVQRARKAALQSAAHQQ
jgi:hypothetical protein